MSLSQSDFREVKCNVQLENDEISETSEFNKNSTKMNKTNTTNLKCKKVSYREGKGQQWIYTRHFNILHDYSIRKVYCM